MRIVHIVLLLLAIPIFALNSCKFIDGYKYWRQSQDIRQSYIAEIKKLEAKRDELLDYVEQLKNDEFTREKIAREQGYIKDGETVYYIAPPVR